MAPISGNNIPDGVRYVKGGAVVVFVVLGELLSENVDWLETDIVVIGLVDSIAYDGPLALVPGPEKWRLTGIVILQTSIAHLVVAIF